MSCCFLPKAGKIHILFFSLIVSLCYSQEICNHVMDDDDDSFIDLNESSDWMCGIGTPGIVSSMIPNSCFEVMSCCPGSYSQMDAATARTHTSSAISDYVNTSNFVMPAIMVSGGIPFKPNTDTYFFTTRLNTTYNCIQKLPIIVKHLFYLL